MIKHIVTWKFRDGTEDEAKKFLDGLNSLVGQIEVLRSVETGLNINPNADQSAVLIATFDSLEDLEKYKNDPRHLAEMQDFFLHFGSLFCVSTPRKTTLPGTHPSATPPPSLQGKARKKYVIANEVKQSRRLEYARLCSRSDL